MTIDEECKSVKLRNQRDEIFFVHFCTKYQFYVPAKWHIETEFSAPPVSIFSSAP